MSDILQIEAAIRAALRERLQDIGVVLSGDGLREARRMHIRATGNFQDKIDSVLKETKKKFVLSVGSKVEYEPFILGGKKPSWTPIEPLKRWVETKKLSWVDKKTEKKLTVDQMAYMIRGKIKREGIPERNIFAEVLKNRESWIFSQLKTVEVNL